MDVATAIKARFSSRSFLDRDVDLTLLEKIFDVARYAPSGVNTQPWQVIVLKSKSLLKCVKEMQQSFDNGQVGIEEYDYYPQEWFEPYLTRRRNCGLRRFAALEITRQDKEKRQAAWRLNYEFFGAPVGLIFLRDKRLGEGSYLDYGMFLQNIMIMASSLGLATCPQAAIGQYHEIIKDLFDVDEDMMVLCGMALGYANNSDPANGYRLGREPVHSFVNWQVEE